jgi:cobaltochelatase CobS
MSDQTETITNVAMRETCVVGDVQHSRWSLNCLSRDEVKKIALAAHTERNASESRAFLGSVATKGQLIDFILGQPIARTPAPVAESQFADIAPQGSKEANAMATLADALKGFLPKPDASLSAEQVSVMIGEAKAYTDDKLASLNRQYAEALTNALEAFNQRCNELAGTPKTIRIEVNERPAIELSGARHQDFDDLLQDAIAFQACGEIAKANFCLTGEAGTGKTTAVKKIAEKLGLDFYFNGAIDSEYKLRGFIDANSRVIYTPFRQAYEHGGVYLFDEMDSSMPSACLAFNAALSNGCYDFPDPNGIKPIPRHNTCFIFGATNTWKGPEGEYVGRMRQDGAFLDRFMRVPWHTDEKFERALCRNSAWCDYVQKVRAKVHENGIEHIVSPRATLNGEVLLAAGRPWQRVVDICVRKGLNQEDWNKVRGEAL